MAKKKKKKKEKKKGDSGTYENDGDISWSFRVWNGGIENQRKNWDNTYYLIITTGKNNMESPGDPTPVKGKSEIIIKKWLISVSDFSIPMPTH